MAITFDRVQKYLDAIADKAKLDASDSGHVRFWQTSYNSFITGNVPSKLCGGKAVPIINQPDKINSAFYLILQHTWCAMPVMPQMPKTGPYITDPGYTVTLPDKSVVSGTQILHDLGEWLNAGAPEHG